MFWLKGETVAQIAAIRNDARNGRALCLVGDQTFNEIDLVHGNELEDLGAHAAVCVARQRVDNLQPLGRLRRPDRTHNEILRGLF